MDRGLVQLGVREGLLHREQSGPEQVHAELLESGPGDLRVEVDAVVKSVDFQAGFR